MSVRALIIRHPTRAAIVMVLIAAALAVPAHFLMSAYYGVLPEDLLHVNVVQIRPADLAPQLQGSRIHKSELDASFRTGRAGVFKWLELDWDDDNGEAPDAITFRSPRSTPIPPEVKARLEALLGTALAANGSWTHDGTRIQLTETKLTLSVDPKTKAAMFTRRVAAGFRVLDAAAFGAPLYVDADEMHAVFGID